MNHVMVSLLFPLPPLSLSLSSSSLSPLPSSSLLPPPPPPLYPPFPLPPLSLSLSSSSLSPFPLHLDCENFTMAEASLVLASEVRKLISSK